MDQNSHDSDLWTICQNHGRAAAMKKHSALQLHVRGSSTKRHRQSLKNPWGQHLTVRWVVTPLSLRVMVVSHSSGWPSQWRWHPTWAGSWPIHPSVLPPWTQIRLSDLWGQRHNLHWWLHGMILFWHWWYIYIKVEELLVTVTVLPAVRHLVLSFLLSSLPVLPWGLPWGLSKFGWGFSSVTNTNWTNLVQTQTGYSLIADTLLAPPRFTHQRDLPPPQKQSCNDTNVHMWLTYHHCSGRPTQRSGHRSQSESCQCFLSGPWFYRWSMWEEQDVASVSTLHLCCSGYIMYQLQHWFEDFTCYI